MRTDDLFDPLKGFDHRIVKDKEFREDSVREEMITPLLHALGYLGSGNNKIIRSRKLLHPFVSIGSIRKKIFIVPDYLMQVSARNAWILEAKSPDEPITNSVHVEQAYSYAIHSEIRVKYFALCNGKEFALYAIGEPELLLYHFPMRAVPRYWEALKKRLSPEKIFQYQYKPNKDFGLHLKRLGFQKVEILVFYDIVVSMIARLGNDLFTFTSNTISEGETYCASFDFSLSVARQLEGLIPLEGFELLMQPFQGEVRKIYFADTNVLLSLTAFLGDKLEEDKNEFFLPLTVTGFLQP